MTRLFTDCSGCIHGDDVSAITSPCYTCVNSCNRSTKKEAVSIHQATEIGKSYQAQKRGDEAFWAKVDVLMCVAGIVIGVLMLLFATKAVWRIFGC